jgi:hypothetical protein
MPPTRAILIPLLLATLAWADATTDRNAIEHIVAAVTTEEKPANLFTQDADSDLTKLKILDRQRVAASKAVWSELSMPVMTIESIRFLTADVALVNAANSQFGSTTLRQKIPVLVILLRQGNEWKIASLRLLSDPAPQR